VILAILGFVALFAILVAGGDMIRKDLPYDIEVVPRFDSVGIINKTEWVTRDLGITIKSSGSSQLQTTLPGDTKETLISGLTPETRYSVAVFRKDLLGKIKYRPKIFEIETKNRPYIVLVGASVGYSWNLPGLPKRLKDDGFVLGYRMGKEGFDKEKTIRKLLSSKIKPDAVIIKECAAYFPRELKENVTKIEEWVRLLSNNGVIPILATCAPVTRENDLKYSGRMKSINEFNEFIRNFARKKRIAVLDLQKALEDGSEMHYLKREYARQDGLHLVSKAYSEALDPIVFPVLEKVFQ